MRREFQPEYQGADPISYPEPATPDLFDEIADDFDLDFDNDDQDDRDYRRAA